MRWIEVIHLRSVNNNRKQLDLKLHELIRTVDGTTEEQSVRVYDREMIDTDICIVLFQNIRKGEIGGSRLGLRLVAELKEFGLVNHSVWLER